MRRLTPEYFKKLLEAHPDFKLFASSWAGYQGIPCSGCAMTLAYYHEHLGQPMDGTATDWCQVAKTVKEWSYSTFGQRYALDFIYGFDSCEPDEELGSHVLSREGYHDGVACRALAYELCRMG